ncbi:MAG: hypothetical protein KAW16_03305 [candidate division Zixibacteria bacterium]|nr:hypothetical protein [candidate division Zixibacteria bacterium]
MQKNLFELRFVHTEDLIFHETCDFKRTQKLAEEIKRDGHLKNPVLVGCINTEGTEDTEEGEKLIHRRVKKLLVLDGVNRVSALRLLNLPDVLIQIVDYEDKKVKLSSWDHLIFNAQKEEIIKKIKDLNLEVSFCPFNWRKEALNHQKTISYFLFRDLSGFVVNNGRSRMVHTDGSFTPENKVKNLYQLIATYNGRSEICYLDSENHFLSVFEHFKNSSAINLIPKFDKKEILGLVQKGILLPFGVTRFIVPHRVLGLEVSCSVLRAQTPLSEKNLFLKELLTYRIKTKKAKFYQESVTLFNE